MTTKRYVYIDAKTGMFVTESYARANPSTTVRMDVTPKPAPTKRRARK